MDSGAKLLVFTASWSMIQGLIQIIYTQFMILETCCLTELMTGHSFLVWARLLYVNNPRCGHIVNVGLYADSLPNQALVLVNEMPRSTKDALGLAVYHCIFGIVWIFSSICLLIGVKKQSKQCRFYVPWLFTSLFAIFADIFFGLLFFSDVNKTMSLLSIVEYIGGTATGFGGGDVNGTMIPAVVMGLYSIRGGVGLILNVILFFKAIPIATKHMNHTVIYQIELDEMPTPRRDPESQRDNNGHEENENRPDNVPSLRRPEETAFTSLYAYPSTAKYIAFPTSLLSIPQQLDKALAVHAGRPRVGVENETPATDAHGDDVIETLEPYDEDKTDKHAKPTEKDTMNYNESFKIFSENIKAILKPNHEGKKICGNTNSPSGSSFETIPMKQIPQTAWNSDVLY